MLQVEDPVLVQEVIHVLVHALDDVVSDLIVLIRTNLEHADFHILEKVPCYDFENVSLVIIDNDLKPFKLVFVSLVHPDNLIGLHELDSKINECLSIFLSDK